MDIVDNSDIVCDHKGSLDYSKIVYQNMKVLNQQPFPRQMDEPQKTFMRQSDGVVAHNGAI